jgi:hypothetical protein
MDMDRHLSLRLTEKEWEHLESCRGRLGKSAFVRDLIREARPHRHTRDTEVRTEMRGGQSVTVWRCTCGKEMT